MFTEAAAMGVVVMAHGDMAAGIGATGLALTGVMLRIVGGTVGAGCVPEEYGNCVTAHRIGGGFSSVSHSIF